jgi:hypothetical protein
MQLVTGRGEFVCIEICRRVGLPWLFVRVLWVVSELRHWDFLGLSWMLDVWITRLLRGQCLPHEFMHGCSRIQRGRWTSNIIHLDYSPEIFYHFMTLVDPCTSCTLWFLRESCISRVNLRFQSVHSVRKCLVLLSKFRYQSVNVLFIFWAQMTIPTPNPATRLCPCVEHFPPIEWHLLLLYRHLLQVNLVTETVGLA